MVRVFALTALPLAAASVPRISLDLSAAGTLITSARPAQEHPEGFVQPDGAKVMSRQDWSEECAASDATSQATCPFPEARAYDHNDQVIKVREQVWLVDQNGRTFDDKQVARADVAFNQPAIYLFKFDATDTAGNHAEQVVFSLILNDKTAPKITLCSCPDHLYDPIAHPNAPKGCIFDEKTGEQRLTVESSAGWKLCRADAKDNCGPQGCASQPGAWSDISKSLRYCVTKCAKGADCKETAKACANWVVSDDISINKELATMQTGQYLVKVGVADDAGRYGSGAASNKAEALVDVTIEDTTAPVITPLGQAPTELVTCDWQSKYDDSSNGAGRDATRTVDNLDTKAQLQSALVADISKVNTGIPDDYWVTYDVTDTHGNKADQAKRLVKVRDETDPTVEPKDGRYMIDYLVGSVHDVDTIDAGVTVGDKCDQFIAKREVTRKWVALPKDPKTGLTLTKWEANKVGTFVREYKVCDAASRCSAFRRTFVGTDKTAPIITVLGKQEMTIHAKRNGPAYEDAGATCRDYVDGLFSATVSEKGDEVDPTKPGTYIIRYECTDLAGNPAQEMTRTVHVKDVDCPKITLKGSQVMQIEAGSKFVDPGWTTVDEIDGDISKKCTGAVKGCTEVTGEVNAVAAFTSRSSCAEIKQFQKDATPSGYYYITSFIQMTKSFSRVKVWCDMDTMTTDKRQPGFTYYECDGCKSTVPYGKNQGDCGLAGMRMAQFDDDSLNSFRQAKQWAGAKGMLPSQFFTAAGIPSTNYLCSKNDHNDEVQRTAQDSVAAAVTHDQMTANEEGKYIITYQAKDMSLVPACATKTRTVVVRDTFAPVITLHLRNKLIQWSSVKQANNPAASNKANPFLKDGPFLMAESATGSADAWVVGAVASAVTGLALLTYSARATAPVTVPV
jgi:hypothetical protein